MGRATSPVSKSAPAKQASNMVTLSRNRRLVTMAKMTSEFSKTVRRAAIKSILARAIKCL